jgi:hypothetical protein
MVNDSDLINRYNPRHSFFLIFFICVCPNFKYRDLFVFNDLRWEFIVCFGWYLVELLTITELSFRNKPIDINQPTNQPTNQVLHQPKINAYIIS